MSENNMTKSQAKRKARQEESQKAKHEAKRTKFTTNLILILVVALFAVGIGSFVYYKMTTTQSSSDYGAFLNDDGTIKNVNPTDYITPMDYKNIVVPKEELVYSEEEMQAAIDSLLTTYEGTEFTDEFVAEHLSATASTVEEYKEYLKTTNENNKLQNFLVTYINENATASSYNEEHIKYLKGIIKNDHVSYYNSYNTTMMMYTGSPVYKSFSEYIGMTNKEFEVYLDAQARSRAAIDMTFQYIFTDAGLTIEEDDYQATAAAMGTSAFDTYGRKYIMHMTMKDVVISYLMENATIQ